MAHKPQRPAIFPEISNGRRKADPAMSSMQSVDVIRTAGATEVEPLLSVIGFLEDLCEEVDGSFDMVKIDPHLRMAIHLVRSHLEGRTVTPTALIGASRVPYATATRRLAAMRKVGLIEERPRTPTGRSVSLHPSAALLESWSELSDRLHRLAAGHLELDTPKRNANDYFFGGSYGQALTVPPLAVLPTPLRLGGGLRVLAHGDPTFMVMENLKRQFEQVIGLPIHQRIYSIDRLRNEALKNAERPVSRYDIIAVDLPWIGEFARNEIILPLDEALDAAALDPADFHTAGWEAAHWAGRPFAVPAQTTPEVLFYRMDLFDEAGLTPPTSTDELLTAARTLHQPARGRHGIAWNGARGTALGHTVLMALADFGQPVLDLAPIAGRFDTSTLAEGWHRPTIDTGRGLAAAEFLRELLDYSPPNTLSMSWFERIRPYAAGSIAMAYGYTLLAPYFELDESSPACGRTGYLPHPPAPGCDPIAPVGGYVLCIPANLPPERVGPAAKAIEVFTSPGAQKMYIQNGSRTNPRYSVGADPEVRRISPVFEAVDGMSWRDELQFWPRPPVPEISDIIQICGEEFHDMLRGLQSPKDTLRKAQARADKLFDVG